MKIILTWNYWLIHEYLIVTQADRLGQRKMMPLGENDSVWAVLVRSSATKR